MSLIAYGLLIALCMILELIYGFYLGWEACIRTHCGG